MTCICDGAGCSYCGGYDCPTAIREILDRYMERVDPGDFLLAILSNNLFEACRRADDENRYRIFDIVKYIYNTLPVASYGTPDRVAAWLGAAPQVAPC